MKKLHVGCSPLTGTIFCGTLLKDNTWSTSKQDVTMDALVAVCLHVLHKTGCVEITNDGKVEYEITVKRP